MCNARVYKLKEFRPPEVTALIYTSAYKIIIRIIYRYVCKTQHRYSHTLYTLGGRAKHVASRSRSNDEDFITLYFFHHTAVQIFLFDCRSCNTLQYITVFPDCEIPDAGKIVGVTHDRNEQRFVRGWASQHIIYFYNMTISAARRRRCSHCRRRPQTLISRAQMKHVFGPFFRFVHTSCGRYIRIL